MSLSKLALKSLLLLGEAQTLLYSSLDNGVISSISGESIREVSSLELGELKKFIFHRGKLFFR